MKQIIVIVAVLAAAAGAFMACGKEKVHLNVGRIAEGRGDVLADWSGLRVTGLSCNEECSFMDWSEWRDTVDLLVRDGKLYVTHHHIFVSCTFKTVEVKVSRRNDTIIIRDAGKGGWSKCICFTDAEFCVEGIPSGHYTVRVMAADRDFVHTEEIDI